MQGVFGPEPGVSQSGRIAELAIHDLKDSKAKEVRHRLKGQDIDLHRARELVSRNRKPQLRRCPNLPQKASSGAVLTQDDAKWTGAASQAGADSQRLGAPGAGRSM
jgi:hypothetical protein